MFKLSALLVALPVLALMTGCGGAAEDENDVTSADESLSVKHLTKITTISYAPNSYVIGNAYPGWTDDVQGNAQFSKGPGNEGGVSYRWGFLFGENFDHCAWVGANEETGTKTESGSRCGAPQEIDTPHFMSTYTNGDHNDLAGDGSDTHMHYAGKGCSDTYAYGNVAPWRVPAIPANKAYKIPDGKLLKWRYVTKDGRWVLARDPAPPANEPNWIFVERGCVSLANKN